ncbi:MAG: hypothetical protein QNJ68_03990 [Microcoleaceae cyanobacterium MO_207.B10]|nr:hypothetical protein [Microcoleaceae cyanobacterium MO_207.B10]
MEKRFLQQCLNDNITRIIIYEAKANQKLIGIKNLKDIRELKNKKLIKKTKLTAYNSWVLSYLRKFIEYKYIIKEPVEVVAVTPDFTNQTSHNFLDIRFTSNKSLKCKNYSDQKNADVHGAKMISLWGCNVNQPQSSKLLSCKVGTELLKA